MPIISAFPTGESTVDYTGPKSGLPALEEGKVGYATDEKHLYTGNADGQNTQIPNADDLKMHTDNGDIHVTAEKKAVWDKSVVIGEKEINVQLPNIDSSWECISYCKDKFLISGDQYIAYSSDGIQWTKMFSPVGSDCISFCDADGFFWSVCTNAEKVVFSFDGTTWLSSDTNLKGFSDQLQTSYGNGTYVILGPEGLAYAKSMNGWKMASLPDTEMWWEALCFGKDKFVVIGNSDVACYSEDGITWTQITMPANAFWASVCYADSKFVAVSRTGAKAAYSTDGINWVLTSTPIEKDFISVCYGDGKFIAVSWQGDVAIYSTDGIHWEQTSLPMAADWQSVCYGDGKFVATANRTNAYAYSTDGINWTTKAIIPTVQNTAGESSIDSIKAALQYSPAEIGAEVNGTAMQVFSHVTEQMKDLANKTEVSDAVDSHNLAEDAHAAKFAKKGDMFASVYDPQGKKQDVFQYADAKASAAKSVADTAQTGLNTHITSENAHADKFAAVNAAIGNLTPSACKVTLTASGWDSSAKTQSATVSGVLEDESKQLIMPMPAGTSMSAYNEAGIQMTAQAANTVTFTADTVPTADVEVWVVVQAVNDVTPPPLDQASWDYISKQSLAGNAKNIWAVGDCKKIKLSGTASKLSLNTELYVYILDFDHDSSTVGGTKDGITFGTFKTALTDGKDVCLVSGYEDDSDFIMNTTNANSGGWKNSDMRYNILGSTNTQNGNATATTATSPKSNTLMSCLPADLRAVMRPMCVYTDNTGGGSDTASCVTTTIDFLPLLAEFEIHGTQTCANSAEKNNQTQYAYFKNGSSKVKYRHDSQSSAVHWWSRSPYSASSIRFCIVGISGSANYIGANYSSSVAPAFKV